MKKIITIVLIVFFAFSTDAYCQGNSGNSGGSSRGDQDTLGTQDRDRDKVQDPLTHDGDEPIQDRIQDRIQGSGVLIGDDVVQSRDQLRDQMVDQDQDRDRDQIRANDFIGLQEIISIVEEADDEEIDDLDSKIQTIARNRNRVEASVKAFEVAQNMLGQYGQVISDTAQEIRNTHQNIIQNEEQIQSRGLLRHLFFGGDNQLAEEIQNQIQQNERRMQQIRQYLDDCDCDENVRNMLKEQVRNMEEEHNRLKQVADTEVSQWGIFSWRF